MKHLIIALILLTLVGCATIPQGTAPSSSPLISTAGEDIKYRLLGPSEASAGHISLFGFIPLGRTDIDAAITEAINNKGGDNLINIGYNVDYKYYILFGKTSLTLKGDAIKYTESGETDLIIQNQGDMYNQEIDYKSDQVKLPLGHQLNVNLFSDGTAINYNLIFPFNKVVFGKLSIGYRGYEEKLSQTYFGGTFEYTAKYAFIPITFSAGVNSEKLIQSEIPVNGTVGLGFGYYPDVERIDKSNGHEGWLNFGWNIGLGAEYKVIPNLALGIYYNFHQIFTGESKMSFEGTDGKPSFSETGISLRYIP